MLPLTKTDDVLRYGENPHQEAARYRLAGTPSWWDGVAQHSGLALSYLNYYDAEAAWQLAFDLGDRPAVAIIKHANPCGVAVADDLATAYQLALEADELSAFGGIVAVNRPIDGATVERMVAGPQADVIIAPGYGDGRSTRWSASARTPACWRRPAPWRDDLDYRQLTGGFLVQQAPHFAAGRTDWTVPSPKLAADRRSSGATPSSPGASAAT